MATKVKRVVRKREPNGLEAQVLKKIKSIKSRKVKVGYETERLPYYLARSYIPDFVIDLPGRRIL